MMMKFTLWNYEGCRMDETYAKSLKDARNHFKSFFEGKYKLVCESTGETKNVRL